MSTLATAVDDLLGAHNCLLGVTGRSPSGTIGLVPEISPQEREQYERLVANVDTELRA